MLKIIYSNYTVYLLIIRLLFKLIISNIFKFMQIIIYEIIFIIL